MNDNQQFQWLEDHCRDAALAGFPASPIPANTVKLLVAFKNKKFQVPIKYYGSARRGIGAARPGPQFSKIPVAFAAPRHGEQCS